MTFHICLNINRAKLLQSHIILSQTGQDQCRGTERNFLAVNLECLA